jgi:LacI family transcriptional regulator
MPVSQQKIADALSLSVITVSRALRDHPDMAEATKARVLQKARELGYTKFKKRQAANQPAPRRAGILLYENPHGARQDPLASGVKRAIFLALQKECQRLEVETMIETPSADEIPLLVKNGTVTAAFIFGRYTAETVAHLRNIPSIAVSSFIDYPGLPRIVADNFNGMRLATEHLIKLGHRDILFIGLVDTHTRVFEERADGYVTAMHRNGLTPSVRFHETLDSLPSATDVRNYTAVVCASDGLAYTLHSKLVAAGMKLPEECSLVGFDNLPTDNPYPLTTYCPNWELMGRMAADLLLSKPLDIRNQDIVITVAGKLLVRDSTRPPAPSTELLEA